MANFVKNHIRLIGNEAIKQLAKEINRRLIEVLKKNDFEKDLTVVGKILYGYDDDKADLSKEMRAKWVHPDGQIEEWYPLNLVSGWWPVKEIQDHILRCAAKVDPKVIVYMEYDDEMPNFVGARYILLDNGKIKSFESEIDTSNFNVVTEDELEELIENEEDDEDNQNTITWDDIWGLLHQQQSKALEAMQSQYKWAKDDQAR
jgi:hypothetical protein